METLLEDEQKELLARFVEAHRNAPRELRGEFIAYEIAGSPQATFSHSQIDDVRFSGSMGDAEVLAQEGLLRLSYSSRGDRLFYVLPRGIQFYEEIRRAAPATETLETEIRHFLSGSEFQERHSAAFAKWNQAASLLWSADSPQQLTTIGHLCREALQEFAASLARQRGVNVSHLAPSKTVARLEAVLSSQAAALGATERPFLEALVAYWRTVSDLAQRQEHGGQREQRVLVWEDARRLVFQTCIVMFELSRALA